MPLLDSTRSIISKLKNILPCCIINVQIITDPQNNSNPENSSNTNPDKSSTIREDASDRFPFEDKALPESDMTERSKSIPSKTTCCSEDDSTAYRATSNTKSSICATTFNTESSSIRSDAIISSSSSESQSQSTKNVRNSNLRNSRGWCEFLEILSASIISGCFLDIDDFLHLRLVCKELKDVQDEVGIFRQFYKKHFSGFGISPDELLHIDGYLTYLASMPAEVLELHPTPQFKIANGDKTMQHMVIEFGIAKKLAQQIVFTDSKMLIPSLENSDGVALKKAGDFYQVAGLENQAQEGTVLWQGGHLIFDDIDASNFYIEIDLGGEGIHNSSFEILMHLNEFAYMKSEGESVVIKNDVLRFGSDLGVMHQAEYYERVSTTSTMRRNCEPFHQLSHNQRLIDERTNKTLANTPDSVNFGSYSKFGIVIRSGYICLLQKAIHRRDFRGGNMLVQNRAEFWQNSGYIYKATKTESDTFLGLQLCLQLSGAHNKTKFRISKYGNYDPPIPIDAPTDEPGQFYNTPTKWLNLDENMQPIAADIPPVALDLAAEGIDGLEERIEIMRAELTAAQGQLAAARAQLADFQQRAALDARDGFLAARWEDVFLPAPQPHENIPNAADGANDAQGEDRGE